MTVTLKPRPFEASPDASVLYTSVPRGWSPAPHGSSRAPTRPAVTLPY